MSRRSRALRGGERPMQVISGRLRAQKMRVTAPLRRGVYLVPVAITSIGLLIGFYAIVASLSRHFELASVLITVAFFCDGLDGRVARASRTSSQFGVEYDSLADVVAFGVTPATLAYTWALAPAGVWGAAVSGLFVVCAALRLARFNIQTASADKNRFVGLPVPGAAMMIAGSALAYSYFELNSPRALCGFGLVVILALTGLMVSRVPYPSFKALDWHRRAPVEILLAVLVFAAFLFAMPQFTAFALSTAYLLSGPVLMARGERMQEKVAVLRPVLPQHSDESGQAGSMKQSPAASETRGRRTGSLESN
ncbi:MAG: CDP-diacylglycerol--serine O-phosphatidyltransferase [Candidatus Binataceae bacterium]